ncbi:BlaI/MecI/CopY family transcriptional regulator [Schlesneria paludicola]|uniref:BlaI/MecI/CopY family transcriptional regulator n=1 Tax=Schlesneria paludicola TaxID=360056 RepID=UPI00029AC9C5|nr:BlaI/MecI/CopY family transcriptional regulator [Schlesneria paludicola]
MGNENGPGLTAAQREIMEIVWKRGSVTVTEVRDALAQERELARNTVQTMIVRLEEKGWLVHREEGRTFVYSAARPRKVSLGAKVAQLVDRWFAGSSDEMVTALIEYRGLSADEAERIRQMVEEAEAKTKRQNKRGRPS